MTRNVTTQGPQKPKLTPLVLDAVHVEPASVVQSAGAWQTVIPGAGHDLAHLVPVNIDHSGHVMQQWVAVVGRPVPQQMDPPLAAVQSMASSHSQSTEFATGQAVPIASQVEGDVAPTGTSQQC
jgi:hypothetical protein